MSEQQKKLGTAFWASVVLAVAVFYVVSVGPACWFAIMSELNSPVRVAYDVVYSPLYLTAHHSRLSDLSLRWYLDLFTPELLGTSE